ncbi:50S ribosomal protein L5 [Candidatus Daviesbacteria bacterium RIFCSPLOWO2_02_FULL_40_8]|uniref:Large ribosomal subunit protein uL5 n=1 Tax=Candidatus Daviesbacteria bacterium RIFCSPLOWO2_01_FULL_40_24 TaxID=1797787 RepID=A0A1F5MJT2_9BACT|nr:MAG: 50S ribosomal protein L5 [Candidatus Daviesbacteria bacterium RIFCSPHIGHO2_01_FULL_41_45]OGE35391.1 MAG: 50S ribosomal protein L5 [Candidatus Daviesbacteria bacterium RIFCSPHIGHO2_02_FULL_41_14]OGE65634.1 MAG: 50S ribosomal protein L5 [Candidatus Daviesbacteria bacterium RIFCSPLOWO2_01_FULL_40_24]OGE66313.1 MAG: 50S ribosomal protein L5 [Candidatus Daviesbacteria bacterium RIFCSPLOWO2_02_FULL_40_8]
MSRLKIKYRAEIQSKLQEEFGIKNKMAIPTLKKIVVNVGVGEAKDNQGVLDTVVKEVSQISGQKAVITKAKKSISGFKVGKGQSVGVMVTLRGDRMYDFLDKLVTIALPKVRDFRGLSRDAFDNQGNYTLGLREQTLFPEISFHGSSQSGKMRGLEISMVTTAQNKEQGRRLLELLGVPFKKEQL